MEQLRRRPPITIAIPASLVVDTPHLREKTFKIGMIGRAAAIFRVDEIIVFRDIPLKNPCKEAENISLILSYMETPQYLRKRLFPFNSALRYVGILPPLRTTHHPLEKRVKDLKIGQLRDGIVIQADSARSYVDIGVEHLALVREPNLPIGRRVTVRVLAFYRNTVDLCLIDRIGIDIYWGYHAIVTNLTLGQMLSKSIFDLIVLTSKYGKPLTETIEKLKRRWKEANKVLIAFGSPKQGLQEILEYDGVNIDDVDALVINTICQQGTETIRTEEAVYATLAVMNIIL